MLTHLSVPGKLDAAIQFVGKVSGLTDQNQTRLNVRPATKGKKIARLLQRDGYRQVGGSRLINGELIHPVERGCSCCIFV